MQVVIPMSGAGRRFQDAGYTVPKPLIEVEGRAIIAHVADLYAGESNLIFICSRAHLDDDTLAMGDILRAAAPQGRIVAIDPHKLGPVHAVREIRAELDPDAETIVNYCDFTCRWDYADFKRFVAETGCAGAIPAYRGFHPHSPGSTFYAYVRQDGLWASDIREKQPFTANPMDEFASTGAYYFRSAALMLDAMDTMVDHGLTISGEYYVSLAYKPLFARKAPVAVYEVEHFMQWGTPEDLREYEFYSSLFRALGGTGTGGGGARHPGSLAMPMAGLGQRFADEGFSRPKPLVEVSGRPMAVQAANDMPACDGQTFVVRTGMAGRAAIEGEIAKAFPEARFIRLDHVTEGQAETVALGLDGLDPALPVTIAACDNGALYDAARLQALLDDESVDVIVWGARGHPAARKHPHMFSWVECDDEGRVSRITLKAPVGDSAEALATDPIVTGAFTFRRAGDFLDCHAHLVATGARVNGELYVDAAINSALALGLDVRLFEVDHHVGWGTPDEWRSFNYWQSCFDLWHGHPYRLEDDARLPAGAAKRLRAERSGFTPARPTPLQKPS